jgi:hypothetical protein
MGMTVVALAVLVVALCYVSLLQKLAQERLERRVRALQRHLVVDDRDLGLP